MISEEQFNILCFQGKSNCVDYKRAQYAFQGASDAQKAELLKDILCFANAFRRSTAYILIGVDEDVSGLGVIHGIDDNEVIDDAQLQQFINSKTNKRIPFSAYPLRMNLGKILQVIEIDTCVRGRPKNVLDFTKRLVSCVKRHVARADINAAVLECVEKKVKALCN